MMPASRLFHQPVLLQEVVDFAPDAPVFAVDATVGSGGHALALLKAFPNLRMLLGDRDYEALAWTQQHLSEFSERWQLVQTDFADLGQHVLPQSVDFLIADLGVSNHQIDSKARGFSFMADAPLDMRMNQQQETTAKELVNNLSKAELVHIFRTYGEEKFAPLIAQKIIEKRKLEPLHSTLELASIVRNALPSRSFRHSKYPEARVFQALRMALNQELQQLEKLIEQAVVWLKPGGRMAVISFHSLEDRLVKQYFRLWSRHCICAPATPVCICNHHSLGRQLTKKPMRASAAEIELNSRARSARLRVFEKLLSDQ